MSLLQRPLHAVMLSLLLAAPLAQAQVPPPHVPTIDLSEEASRTVANDMAAAQAYVEMSDRDPAALARKVNQRSAEVLAALKPYSQVKVQSAGISTYPVYARNGGQIESWRMRNTLNLESRDIPALSEAVGKLQTLAAVDQLQLRPSPETFRKARDEAMVDALKAVETRATVAGNALGKKVRLRSVSIGDSGGRPPIMYRRAPMAMAAAEAAPAPIEAGESQVSVTVSGSFELQ
ncbi:MAG: SIMPL domain-containing protein [Moraxellaceae bacterium]|nr:SIMPL domain-containing protein [Moraxellaceae bacterium]